MAIPWRGLAQNGVCACLLAGVVLVVILNGSVQAAPVARAMSAVTVRSAALSDPTSLPSGCGREPSVRPGTTADKAIATDPAISAGDSSRTYRTHLPAAYVPGEAYAVVLVFHGYGGDAADMERVTGFSALADENQFIAVYPQGLTDIYKVPFWASVGTIDLGIDDVRFVSNLLDALEADFCIDTTRIYATGFSNGGAMVGLLACQLSDRIAAFAPVSGNFYAPRNGCYPGRPIPILEIHGTADQIVSYYGIPEAINPRWPLPSIPMWLRAWAARDNCTDEPATSPSDVGVTMMEWVGCTANSMVIHYRIEGGGHNWPPNLRDRSVAAVIWDFFQAHPLPR